VHFIGSSRLGVYNINRDLVNPTTGEITTFERGRKFFELSNHLGNVLVTISDKKIGVDANNDGTIDYYNADVVTASDYYPFGMVMPGRKYEPASGYRYGFNGKEKDKDLAPDNYDFGARIYDGRIGRWLSVDPLQAKYPSLSPYNFVANTPLQAIDPDGRLIIFVNGFRLGEYKRKLIWKFWIKWPWNQNRFSKEDIQGSKNGNSYWGDETKGLFTSRYKDNKVYFVDGGYKPQSSAQERYDRGVADAQTIIQKLVSKDIVLAQSETIKLVGHSHGGWHSVGMADALKAAGYPVEAVYAKNPHQPDQKVNRLASTVDNITQYSTKSDHVSSDQSQLKGIPVIVPGKISHPGKIPVGEWLVGDSKYAQMEGATLRELPNASDKPLGGHNVDEQIEFIKNIGTGQPGYVGPSPTNPGTKTPASNSADKKKKGINLP